MYIPCTVMLAGLLSATSGGSPALLRILMLRQRYIPVRLTLAFVILRELWVVREALDKVLMSIPLLSSASSALPSLVQTISGAGKPAAEQDRVALSPTEITVAGTGCSVKMALTASRSRRMKKSKI